MQYVIAYCSLMHLTEKYNNAGETLKRDVLKLYYDIKNYVKLKSNGLINVAEYSGFINDRLSNTNNNLVLYFSDINKNTIKFGVWSNEYLHNSSNTNFEDSVNRDVFNLKELREVFTSNPYIIKLLTNNNQNENRLQKQEVADGNRNEREGIGVKDRGNKTTVAVRRIVYKAVRS